MDRQTQLQNKEDARWWLDHDDTVHERLAIIRTYVTERGQPRQDRNSRTQRMYTARAGLGSDPSRSGGGEAGGRVSGNRITLNMVRNIVNALQAKICKNRPKPMFLTQDGDYSLQQKAKKLTQFIEGFFYGNGTYDTTEKCFADAGSQDCGVVKVYDDEDRNTVAIERVFPNELIVDDYDAIYGNPQQIFHVKLYDRIVLKSMFPEHAESIEDADDAKNDTAATGQDTLADQVLVTEAYHLPSAPLKERTDKKTGKRLTGKAKIDDEYYGYKEHDGRRVIFIENATLVNVPYNDEDFPFEIMYLGEAGQGMFGISPAEEVEEIQIELNTVVQDIQQGNHLVDIPRVFMPSSWGNQVRYKFDNKIGSIVLVPDPNMLKFSNPGSASEQKYRYRDTLKEDMYEVSGVSQLSATSQKPAGLESGKALRTFHDIETERFVIWGRKYEDFVLGIARRLIKTMKRIQVRLDAEGDGESPKVKHVGQKFMETIKWKDVDLEDDQYDMKVFPISALQGTPEERTATVEGWIQAGFVDHQQGMQLLEFPDLDRFVDLEGAKYDITEKYIEQILHEGKYIGPEPYMDLPLTMKMFVNAYLRARVENVDEKNLDLMRQFIDETQRLLDQAEQKQMDKEMKQQQMQMQAAQPDAGMPPQPGGGPPIAAVPG